MREILFRGKLSDEGGWIEGCYIQSVVKNSPFAYITPSFPNTPRQVYSITVGQYTGLTDKNGKKIFEGDIVSFKRVNALGYTTSRIGDVRYYDKLPIFYIMATTGDAWDWCDCEDIEVIGNIHDNPELLKGGEQT